jgi:hypothetical protein
VLLIYSELNERRRECQMVSVVSRIAPAVQVAFQAQAAARVVPARKIEWKNDYV